MEFAALPFDSGLEAYRAQAGRLLNAWRAGDAGAVAIFRHNLPLPRRA